MKTLPAGALLVLFTFPALAEKSLLIGELPSAKPEQVGMSSAKLAKVDAKVEELIATRRLAGASVMITRKGRVVYNKTFGLRDIENEKPMEADTIFRIYSMSKAISSAAAMILSDEGKIDIDDPIANYLPEFKKVKVWKEGEAVAPANAPTVRDLLRHTTGYSYGGTGIPEVDQKQKAADPFARENTLAEFSKRMATVPLAFEPGKGWIYGVSTDLLGAVVQSASGMPFEKFLQQRIFAPLGMVDTGFLIPEGKKARVAVVYNSDKRGKLTNNNHDNFRYTTKSKLPSGGGGAGLDDPRLHPLPPDDRERGRTSWHPTAQEGDGGGDDPQPTEGHGHACSISGQRPPWHGLRTRILGKDREHGLERGRPDRRVRLGRSSQYPLLDLTER